MTDKTDKTEDDSVIRAALLAAQNMVNAWRWEKYIQFEVVDDDNWCLRAATGGWSEHETLICNIPIQLRIYFFAHMNGGLYFYGRGEPLKRMFQQFAAEEHHFT